MTTVELLVTARALAIDGWTAEAVRALNAEGVDALLLKGPALAEWLYDRGEPRPYCDADLLVAPHAVGRAERVLERLGYVLRDPEGELTMVSGPHARTWQRPSDSATVDLHHALPSDVLVGRLVWSVLWPRAERLRVAGTPVPVLDEPSRALLVALHALHHGGAEAQLEDLRRALERVPDAIWAEAAGIAERLMTLRSFVLALRLLPAGAAVAERLRLPSPELLGFLEHEPVAGGIERLAARRGLRGRVDVLRRAAFPPPSFMYWWRPWSQKGRGHLAAAYVYRLGWLTAHAATGIRAWRRARAEAPS